MVGCYSTHNYRNIEKNLQSPKRLHNCVNWNFSQYAHVMQHFSKFHFKRIHIRSSSIIRKKIQQRNKHELDFNYLFNYASFTRTFNSNKKEACMYAISEFDSHSIRIQFELNKIENGNGECVKETTTRP